MTISSSSMDAVLAQMRNLAQSAASTSNIPLSVGPEATSSTTGGFAAELERSLNRLASTEVQANSQADAFAAGTSKASLNDVMIDLQKASLAFQTTVQARNRFIQAYQTIASMPV